MTTVSKVPREVFTTPSSAVASKPTEARAAEAQRALTHAIAEQRQRATRNFRASDLIESTQVASLGEKGWGLVAHLSQAQFTTQALNEGREMLSALGFANVALVSDGAHSPIVAQAEMQKPTD